VGGVHGADSGVEREHGIAIASAGGASSILGEAFPGHAHDDLARPLMVGLSDRLGAARREEIGFRQALDAARAPDPSGERRSGDESGAPDTAA